MQISFFRGGLNIASKTTLIAIFYNYINLNGYRLLVRLCRDSMATL
jgi:hypothetical protein